MVLIVAVVFVFNYRRLLHVFEVITPEIYVRHLQ